ncbi:MAG TPA: hypothetical protein ENF78_05195 [Candidatus Bathyarchaeota archaeon]|nr:hypothetical protein [Candidatus Bathyarchaeota archaeon]
MASSLDALLREIRLLRIARSCFFSIDALESYIGRLFSDVEKAINVELKEARNKYLKFLSFPLGGGLISAMDQYVLGYAIIPGQYRNILYVIAIAGIIAFALLWGRRHVLALERVKHMAFERSFVVGELISYIRSFAGARFSLDDPVGYEQIRLMIAAAWPALSLYFAESYQVEEMLSRLRPVLSTLRKQLMQMLEALEGTEMYQGLPAEAKQPFEFLRARLMGESKL